MEPTSLPIRIAVAAQPRLLVDALCSLLVARGAVVVVRPGPSEGVFDVAVVLDPADRLRIPARMHALLDQSEHSTGGAVLCGEDGRRIGEVRTSDELVSALIGGPDHLL